MLYINIIQRLIFFVILGLSFAKDSANHCRHNVLPNKSLVPTLEGLVGIGWDDLMNTQMLPVFANNYSECRLTPDAFYLVPNYVHVISIKRMHLDQAQYYESFENASNPTFLKSNLDASTDKWMAKYLKLSGTFGAEYKYLKTTLVKERLWLMRKTFSYTAYTLTADPDMFHPTFAARIHEISKAIDDGLLRRAIYLAETIIRDFGTHVIAQANVGMKVDQEIFFNSSIVTPKDIHKLGVNADALLKIIGKKLFTGDLSLDINFKDEYEKVVKGTVHSSLKTSGGSKNTDFFNIMLNGMLPNINQSYNLMANHEVNDLVMLNGRNVPLYTLLHHSSLNFTTERVQLISNLLENATHLYYKMNAVSGCMNSTDENFDYQANIDNHKCEEPEKYLPFGGFYQKCTYFTNATDGRSQKEGCGKLDQVNGLTHEYNCSNGFEAVKLFEIRYKLADRTVREPLFDICYTFGTDAVYKDEVLLQTFWCNATIYNPGPSYRFGGLYVENQENLVTHASSCPENHVMQHLASDVTVCVSRKGNENSIPFAGFFSSQSAIQECPTGYREYIVTVFESCEIYYCAAYKNSQDIHIKRPPFEKLSSFTDNNTESTIYLVQNNIVIAKEALSNVQQIVENEMSKSNKTVTLLEQVTEATGVQVTGCRNIVRDYSEAKNVSDGIQIWAEKQIQEWCRKEKSKTSGDSTVFSETNLESFNVKTSFVTKASLLSISPYTENNSIKNILLAVLIFIFFIIGVACCVFWLVKLIWNYGKRKYIQCNRIQCNRNNGENIPLSVIVAEQNTAAI